MNQVFSMNTSTDVKKWETKSKISSPKLNLIHLPVLKFLSNVIYQHLKDILVNLKTFWNIQQLIVCHWSLMLMMNSPPWTLIHFMLDMHKLNIINLLLQRIHLKNLKENWQQKFIHLHWHFSKNQTWEKVFGSVCYEPVSEKQDDSKNQPFLT